VKGVDQRAGILPGSREGPAAGEQQPAARRSTRQGAEILVLDTDGRITTDYQFIEG
jgi:hypothetical protein